MSNNTSVGRGPAHGNNENHDGDPTHSTFGEAASQDDPPVGNDVLEHASADLPGGLAGARAKPGIRQGPESPPDGPNVETRPQEPDAAKGRLPKAKP